MTNKIPTEDHIKQVEQDDRIIQFDNEVASADVLRTAKKLIDARAEGEIEFLKNLPDLLEQDKRSDRFFGMRLNGKSIDDIENKFLAMFAEFVSLMALFIGMLGFGILLWAIFGG
mgnify:FL=1